MSGHFLGHLPQTAKEVNDESNERFEAHGSGTRMEMLAVRQSAGDVCVCERERESACVWVCVRERQTECCVCACVRACVCGCV